MKMDSRIISIATKLFHEHKRHETVSNSISIFLCGGSSEKERELRKHIRKRLSTVSSKYTYRVYFPEDMFIDLILGHGKRDLLSLENLLATSVNVVALLLSSPGTLTELGAFTNYVGLQDKLVVAIDPQYRRARSFINLGPVRFLEEHTQSKIVWSPLQLTNADTLTRQLAEECRNVAKKSAVITGLSSPIWAYDYILSLVYILEPILKNDLMTAIKAVNSDDTTWADCEQSAEAAISSLVNERKISIATGVFSTTKKGNTNLLSLDITKRKIRDRSDFLSQLRMEALNIILRKRNNKIWGKRLAA